MALANREGIACRPANVRWFEGGQVSGKWSRRKARTMGEWMPFGKDRECKTRSVVLTEGEGLSF